MGGPIGRGVWPAPYALGKKKKRERERERHFGSRRERFKAARVSALRTRVVLSPFPLNPRACLILSSFLLLLFWSATIAGLPHWGLCLVRAARSPRQKLCNSPLGWALLTCPFGSLRPASRPWTRFSPGAAASNVPSIYYNFEQVATSRTEANKSKISRPNNEPRPSLDIWFKKLCGKKKFHTRSLNHGFSSLRQARSSLLRATVEYGVTASRSTVVSGHRLPEWDHWRRSGSQAVGAAEEHFASRPGACGLEFC